LGELTGTKFANDGHPDEELGVLKEFEVFIEEPSRHEEPPPKGPAVHVAIPGISDRTLVPKEFRRIERAPDGREEFATVIHVKQKRLPTLESVPNGLVHPICVGELTKDLERAPEPIREHQIVRIEKGNEGAPRLMDTEVSARRSTSVCSQRMLNHSHSLILASQPLALLKGTIGRSVFDENHLGHFGLGRC
jgi:hypothetical protein